MHMRLKNVSMAVAAAGITIVSAGLAGAVPAGASPTSASGPSAIRTVIDTVFAGFVTGGNWRFRYVAADVPMAGCRSAANQNAVASIALKSNTLGEDAHLDLRCGGGHGSVMFGTTADAEGHFQLSPSVGDVLRISIYRDTAACRDEFAATNTRTNNTKMVAVSTACTVVYRHADPGATFMNFFSGVFSPPAANVQLWDFRNVAITSYNGTHGTICGPWPAEKHLAAPVIAVRMIPSDPSNSCRNFSVLLKGTS